MNKIWLLNHDATCMFNNKGGRHYWFAENLIQKGFSPIIFCSNINHFNGERVSVENKYKEIMADNIPFIFIKTFPYHGNGLSRILNWITFYINLFPVSKKIISKHGKPDVILASSVHPLTMVAGIQISRRLGIPCICEVRDLWPEAIFYVGKAKENSLLGKILISGEHWIYTHANAIIFTKEGDIDYLKERGWLKDLGGDIDIKKCHYINNGVDLENYSFQIQHTTLDDKDLQDNCFKIVYTGTIRKVNNLNLVIECAYLLREEKDIKFLIWGTGEMLDSLMHKKELLHLDNLIFKGYVNKKYIPYILSKASLNLLNYSQNMYNWSRGYSSNKLFEYMASAKPILSTVKMGYSPIEKYKCGVSLDSANAKEMAEAIMKIKDMPKEEFDIMGENARKGVSDFDFKVLTNKLIEVINQVLEMTC